jgi:hypothetical protein
MKIASSNIKAILGAATIGSLALSDPSFAAAQIFLGNAAPNALGGSLQVQITVDGGKITAITTPITPSGRNAQYATYAVPILTQEALSAQSATIQGVSGASYISSAWMQSLASAISKAGTLLTKQIPSAPSTSVLIPQVPQMGGDDENEGYEHEGGEGSDDSNRTAQPTRTRSPKPAIKPTAKPTPKPTPAASTLLPLKMGASVIIKSITCVKANVTKIVKAKKPLCPKGFTLKKK